MAEYFFELLTEEIPAWMHEAAQAALKDKTDADLGERAEDRNPVVVNSTPRRLIFSSPESPAPRRATANRKSKVRRRSRRTTRAVSRRRRSRDF